MFPIRLRAARYVANMSQEDVSDRLGIHLDVYQDYESGKREPYLSTGYRLSKLFKQNLGSLSEPIRREAFAIYDELYPKKLGKEIPRPKVKTILDDKYKNAIVEVKNSRDKVRESKSKKEIDELERIREYLVSKVPKHHKVSLKGAKLFKELDGLYEKDKEAFDIIFDLMTLTVANNDSSI